MKFVVFTAILICNTVSLPRHSNVVYLDDDALKMRSSRSMISDIAHEFIQRSAGSSQVNINRKKRTFKTKNTKMNYAT